jgi:hypothetical protein
MIIALIIIITGIISGKKSALNKIKKKEESVYISTDPEKNLLENNLHLLKPINNY